MDIRSLMAVMAAVVLLSGCGPASVSPAAPDSRAQSAPSSPDVAQSPTPTVTQVTVPAATSTPPKPAAAGTALAAVARLTVKGRAPKTGYTRDQFGQAWADVDRNGCDTRNDILRRDLTSFVLKAGTNGCLVLRGTLKDPYTGKTISFVRGVATSTAVQIDHVVALSDAWQKGAQKLSLATRTALANDPLNLLAVDGPTNDAKGDGDAATWLPPNKGYRCAYVARQVAVKTKYHLWTTSAEKDAIVRILTTCPTQTLSVAKAIQLGGGKVEAQAPPTTSAPKATTTGTDPRFDTCKAAKAAGYGPYTRGQVEYGWYRDGDSDGIVCE